MMARIHKAFEEDLKNVQELQARVTFLERRIKDMTDVDYGSAMIRAGKENGEKFMEIIRLKETMYTKEEVVSLLRQLEYDLTENANPDSRCDDIEAWIEENLK